MTTAKPDPASLTVNEAASLRAFFTENENPADEIDAPELINTVTAGIGQSLASARGYLGSLVRKGYLARKDYTEEDRSTYALTAAGVRWAQERGLMEAPEGPVEESPVYEQRPPAPGPAVLEDLPAPAPDDFADELAAIITDQDRANERLFEYARHLSAAGQEVPQALVKAILASRDVLKALADIR